MTREILIVAAALVLALGITPVARRMAHQFGVLDQPNARKVHVKPTPLLGGVAIYSAARSQGRARAPNCCRLCRSAGGLGSASTRAGASCARYRGV